MGGGRNAMSDVQIDGMTDIAPENNVGINNRIYDPQVDAVQEFSVIVNGLQAEYGRYAGGVINVVTKGGTNQIARHCLRLRPQSLVQRQRVHE